MQVDGVFPAGTTLFHATPIRNLEAVLQEGLRPDIAHGRGATNIPGIYLVAAEFAEGARAFVETLHRAAGDSTPVALLQVDVSGLPWLYGDDDDEYAVPVVITRERIRTLQPGVARR